MPGGLLLLAAAATVVLPAALRDPPCVACAVDATAVRRSYSADEWRQLTDGHVVLAEVTEPSGDQPRSRGGGAGAVVVPHPPAVVWTVLVDFESRARWMPNVREIRIARVEGNQVWIAEVLRVLWSDIRITLINTLRPEAGRIEWVLDDTSPHDIAATSGYWYLLPVDGGQTLLQYRTAVDSGRPVPGFVESMLTRRSLPQLLERVRAEVNRRNPS
jgi:carbon monoxide dehydrogenase subunit G